MTKGQLFELCVYVCGDALHKATGSDFSSSTVKAGKGIKLL